MLSVTSSEKYGFESMQFIKEIKEITECDRKTIIDN